MINLFKLEIVICTLFVIGVNSGVVRFIDESMYDDADLVFDERQKGSDMNIRVNIKNLQVHVPDTQFTQSSFPTSDKNNLANIIKDSILKIFGIAPTHSNIHTTEESSDALNLNGNLVPAKYFLEISDFLQNNNDNNDNVDDLKIASRRRSSEILASDEYKIELLENSNNIKNETIKISKLHKKNSIVNEKDKIMETLKEETKFSNQIVLNKTEKEDRHEHNRPVQIDKLTVVTVSEEEEELLENITSSPKSLRSKVVWH